jgi:uncharacterized protein (TIGR02452 family)
LIQQSLFIQNNASLYLEVNSIHDNGKIVNDYVVNNSSPQTTVFSSVDSIRASRDTDKKTGILISCSHRRAGGGWLSGSFAQEESISRSTTWAVQAAKFNSWYKEQSWLGQEGALIIDGLLICDENGKELNEVKHVVFAGVTAANKAALNDEQYWQSEKGIAQLQHKLIISLACAFEEFDRRGVEDVVLCAFGTNVFGWSLEESIEVLHEASKYAPSHLNLICALGSELKLPLAQDIYQHLNERKKVNKNKM